MSVDVHGLRLRAGSAHVLRNERWLTHSLEEIELKLKPTHVLFFIDCDAFEQRSRTEVALLNGLALKQTCRT